MEHIAITYTVFGWQAFYMRPQSDTAWGKCCQLGHGPNGNKLRAVANFAELWKQQQGIDCPLWIDRRSYHRAMQYRNYCEYAHTETY